MAKPKFSLQQTWQIAVGPYRDLFPYLKPYGWKFFLALLFGALYGGASGLLPLVMRYVNARIFPQGTHLSDLTRSGGPEIGAVLVVCTAIPLIFLVRSFCDYLNAYYMAWVSLRVLADLRSKLFEHLLRHSLDFFNRERAGLLISRVANDTMVAQNALTSISSDIIKQPLTIVCALYALLHLDWKFTLMSLVLFPACIVPIVVYGKKVRTQGKKEEANASSMMTVLQETFAGIRVIKAFAREEREMTNFQNITLQQFRHSIKVRKAIEAVGPMVEAVAAAGVGLALFYVWVTHLSAAKFLALLAGIFMLYDPVKKLSRIHLTMQKCFTATTNIFEIMHREPTVQDLPGAVAMGRSAGDIRLENVTFRYRPELPPAVENLNLHLHAGKYYALVGSSGAGKSTILSLLLRFYDPDTGAVLLDGRDVRTIQQRALREQIGIVTQDTFLFHDTILNNIRYGRLDATEDEVIEAAKRAYAHDFILAQPHGYRTVIGDKGCLLSGGQQQRLAIARALLKNAPILLLDEAMSALDSEAEREIQAAFERLSEGRTVVAIAHRLSTVLKADQIVVMHRGQVREIGTHSELLQTSTLYRRLYELQFNVQKTEQLAGVT